LIRVLGFALQLFHRPGSRGTLPKDVDRGRLLIRIGPLRKKGLRIISAVLASSIFYHLANARLVCFVLELTESPLFLLKKRPSLAFSIPLTSPSVRDGVALHSIAPRSTTGKGVERMDIGCLSLFSPFSSLSEERELINIS